MSATHGPTSCPRCGSSVTGEDETCAACGAPLAPAGEEWEEPLLERAADGSRGERFRFRFEGMGATVASLVLQPQKTFARFRWNGGFLAPMLFSVILGGPCVGLAYVIQVYLEAGRLGGQLSGWEFLFFVLVAPPAYLHLRTQLVHVVLLMRGVARRPYEATFRAVAYSNTAVALAWLVPVVGGFLYLLWGTAIEITGLRAAHRLSLGGALLAVLLPTAGLALSLLARATLELLVAV